MTESQCSEFDESSSEDFEFVISPDGDLKSVLIPHGLTDCLPESVQVILELFGIDDIKPMVQRVLH